MFEELDGPLLSVQGELLMWKTYLQAITSHLATHHLNKNVATATAASDCFDVTLLSYVPSHGVTSIDQ